MNNRTIIAGVLAVLVVGLAAFVHPNQQNQENTSIPPASTTSTPIAPLVPTVTTTPTPLPTIPSTPSTTPTTTPKPPVAVPTRFTVTGNLVINNPGQKAGVWYVTYDTTRKAGVSQELRFTTQSSCAINGVTKTCNTTDLTPGMRVTVSGTISGSVVSVTKLTSVSATPAMRTVQLYYYNVQQDPGVTCALTAVQPVTRQIPVTNTPIQDTLRLLIQGSLTSSEISHGFTSEFPQAGFNLVGANLANGVLTVQFSPVANFSGIGQCRANLLSMEIVRTALQFPGVSQVIITPATVFSP